jgi:hypothetical protein
MQKAFEMKFPFYLSAVLLFNLFVFSVRQISCGMFAVRVLCVKQIGKNLTGAGGR